MTTCIWRDKRLHKTDLYLRERFNLHHFKIKWNAIDHCWMMLRSYVSDALNLLICPNRVFTSCRLNPAGLLTYLATIMTRVLKADALDHSDAVCQWQYSEHIQTDSILCQKRLWDSVYSLGINLRDSYCYGDKLSRDMTKPTKWVCAQRRLRSQPGHPPSLIRLFAGPMKKAWVLSYPLSAQRRLWSDWADAQADLSLRLAHSHFVCVVMSRLNCGI